MKKVITIAGSNSQKSINKSLLMYASSLLKDVEIISIDLNDYVLPIYGVDFEEENAIPTAVKKLDKLFDSADGFIISLAEHNGSYAAVFKNTIDWLSRVNMKIWREKPMLLMAASPGGRGGITVLQSAKSYFPFMGGNIISDYSLPSFYDNFSESKITNQKLEDVLNKKVKLFKEAI